MSAVQEPALGLHGFPATRERPRPRSARLHIDLQRGDEGLLRDVDLAELAHALLALLLLLQELALARDVAAVALGEHVLPERAHRLARNDAPAERRLDRDLEHVRRGELLPLLDPGPAA